MIHCKDFPSQAWEQKILQRWELFSNSVKVLKIYSMWWRWRGFTAWLHIFKAAASTEQSRANSRIWICSVILPASPLLGENISQGLWPSHSPEWGREKLLEELIVSSLTLQHLLKHLPLALKYHILMSMKVLKTMIGIWWRLWIRTTPIFLLKVGFKITSTNVGDRYFQETMWISLCCLDKNIKGYISAHPVMLCGY